MAGQTEFLSMLFDEERKVLYPFELAAKLRCSTQHVYDLIDEGKLRAIKITGGGNVSDRQCLRIPAEEWERFLKAATV